MIVMSGNSTNMFHYQDLLRLQQAIESGIDYLNKENENLIDRNKECSYQTIEKNPPEKKKTSALKYNELEIGGIYKDNKEKEWIFLGEADLYKNNSNYNRARCRYIYMPNIEGLERVEDNWFRSNENLVCTIDSYASKKRFFEKVGQLEIIPNKSITFMDDYSFYSVYGDLVIDKTINEQKISNIINERKLEQEKNKQELISIQQELLTKITNSNEKLNLTIEFNESNMINLKLFSLNSAEEFNFKDNYEFYDLLFWPILSVLPMKNQNNLDSIYQVIKPHEDNTEVFDYLVDSDNLALIVKNQSNDYVKNIEAAMNKYISMYENNMEEKGKGSM